MHGMHVLIEQIFSGWDTNMAELSSLLIKNQRRSREEHQEEKKQQKALSLPPHNNHLHEKQRLTNQF
jgi:hypothetical protein